MQWFRILVLCLIASQVAARDVQRFAVEDVRVEGTAPASASGRFAAVASARATAPETAQRVQRFELSIEPACDPTHIFSNGFE